jgi:uncharacterized protein YdeI (YjbR/CyaY-like superfamily)
MKGVAMPTSGVTQLHPLSRAGWRAWLTTNHGSAHGVLLVMDTKASGSQRLSLDDAVEEAICFGWIDSKLTPVDGRRFAVMFTPRRPGGTWSQANKARVESLTSRGLMTDAGLSAVAAAQQDRSWSALDDVDALRVPEDLAQALGDNPEAQRNFERFTVSTKKATLWWVVSAKRSETRARRIAESVRLAADNTTILQR